LVGLSPLCTKRAAPGCDRGGVAETCQVLLASARPAAVSASGGFAKCKILYVIEQQA
jgi:hypothetical protein